MLTVTLCKQITKYESLNKSTGTFSLSHTAPQIASLFISESLLLPKLRSNLISHLCTFYHLAQSALCLSNVKSWKNKNI